MPESAYFHVSPSKELNLAGSFRLSTREYGTEMPRVWEPWDISYKWLAGRQLTTGDYEFPIMVDGK